MQKPDLSQFPSTPGVYLFKDAGGRIIYVGKAIRLRNRLASYFRPESALTPKTRLMVNSAVSIDILRTGTEKEALLLEASLIKKHRPRYNIDLRDDKDYLLFRISDEHPYPRLEVIRKTGKSQRAIRGRVFGPFVSGQSARETWRLIHRNFPLRRCKDRSFGNRTRPCLYYDMRQCLGPCCLDVPRDVYRGILRKVELLLEGRQVELVDRLKKEMLEASDAMQFEKAARLRDQVKAVELTLEKQSVVLPANVSLDLVGVSQTPEGMALGIVFVRNGQLIDGRNFFWSGLVVEDTPEILMSFMAQYYLQGRATPPRRIVLPWLALPHTDSPTSETATASGIAPGMASGAGSTTTPAATSATASGATPGMASTTASVTASASTTATSGADRATTPGMASDTASGADLATTPNIVPGTASATASGANTATDVALVSSCGSRAVSPEVAFDAAYDAAFAPVIEFDASVMATEATADTAYTGTLPPAPSDARDLLHDYSSTLPHGSVLPGKTTPSSQIPGQISCVTLLGSEATVTLDDGISPADGPNPTTARDDGSGSFGDSGNSSQSEISGDSGSFGDSEDFSRHDDSRVSDGFGESGVTDDSDGSDDSSVAGSSNGFGDSGVLVPYLSAPSMSLDADAGMDDENRDVWHVLEATLSEQAGYAVRITSPRNHNEDQLVAMATANAKEHARVHAVPMMADLLAGVFRLAEPVRRIEVVDISHTSGKQTRAGMVVFENEQPLKSAYRTYALDDEMVAAGYEAGDDYAALGLWAARRARAGEPWADLVLVDGGKGQLAAVHRAFVEAGVADKFMLASIAKARDEDGHTDRRAGNISDRIFLPQRSNPLPLKPGSAELLFLQRVRDTVHDFTIGRHRKARAAATMSGELTRLPGVGRVLAKTLFTHFGSLAAMAKASEEELQTVPGVGKARATMLAKRLALLMQEQTETKK